MRKFRIILATLVCVPLLVVVVIDAASVPMEDVPHNDVHPLCVVWLLPMIVWFLISFLRWEHIKNSNPNKQAGMSGWELDATNQDQPNHNQE